MLFRRAMIDGYFIGESWRMYKVYDFNKIAAMNISETLYHFVMCLASLLLTLKGFKAR